MKRRVAPALSKQQHTWLHLVLLTSVAGAGIVLPNAAKVTLHSCPSDSQGSLWPHQLLCLQPRPWLHPDEMDQVQFSRSLPSLKAVNSVEKMPKLTWCTNRLKMIVYTLHPCITRRTSFGMQKCIIRRVYVRKYSTPFAMQCSLPADHDGKYSSLAHASISQTLCPAAGMHMPPTSRLDKTATLLYLQYTIIIIGALWLLT